MKKLFSITLAILMCLSSTISAKALEIDGSVNASMSLLTYTEYNQIEQSLTVQIKTLENILK